jgi:hypothetical protein
VYTLHCTADYHSGKHSPLLLKFLQNSKSMKTPKQKKGLFRVFVVVVRWCSSLSQRHFKLDNYVYSVGVKTMEML